MLKIVNGMSFNVKKIKTFSFEQFKKLVKDFKNFDKSETQLKRYYFELTGVKVVKNINPEKK